MASSVKVAVGNDFIKVMETFPCLFNIGMIKTPSHTRLRLLIRSLESDIEENENVKFGGGKLQDLNVLSWVYFQVGDIEEAKSKNDEALYLNTDNLVTLGNRAFLEWYSGSNLSTFLEHLEKLKLEEDFPERRMDAKGCQANLLFRLGGAYNMSTSLNMYNDLVGQQSENFEWKYFICLAHRRLMVMNRKMESDNKLNDMFNEVVEKATDPQLKSAAMCELAILLASNMSPIQAVECLVEKALALDKDSPVVLRKCGMALTRLGNPKGITLLERSVSIKESTVSQHSLAKSYLNFKLTINLNRRERDRKAEENFKKSYEGSLKDNIKPYLDLGYLYLWRHRFNESLEVYRSLIQNWSVTDVYKSPFMVSKISEGLYQALNKTGGKGSDPYFDRYLSIAISIGLENFKRHASFNEKSCMYDMIINPANRMPNNSYFRDFTNMIKECLNGNCARQKLIQLRLKGQLGDEEHVIEEIDKILKDGESGEALLMLDIIALQDHNSLNLVSPQQLLHTMEQEAQWQLSQGLIPCKLLFHRMFNINHSNSSLMNTKDDEIDKDQVPEADVLILKDGHHWKPFLQQNTKLVRSDKTSFEIIYQNQMFEDILHYVFDLEVITNPWLSFSGGNQPDTKEFCRLLKQFNVQLVLLVVDDDTSTEFLTMTNYLLSKTLENDGTDIAIVYTEGDTEKHARDQLPQLADRVRCFNADKNKVTQRNSAKPVTELMGPEILDAYFSGSAENAFSFFHFLAPNPYK